MMAAQQQETGRTVAESGPLAIGDCLHFIWQKLNDLDTRFADFQEKSGRVNAHLASVDAHLASVDERLTSIDRRLEKTEETLSKVEKKVEHMIAWGSAAITIAGALFALYRLLETPIRWH